MPFENIPGIAIAALVVAGILVYAVIASNSEW